MSTFIHFQESYDRAKAILKNHSTEHKALANALLLHETLDKDQIKAVIESKGRGGDKITPKRSKNHLIMPVPAEQPI